ncbi:MAG: hypothetical protein R3B06_10120 [Kofleriaceae bacterium]
MVVGLPRWLSPTVAALLIVTLVLSLGGALAEGFGALALVPASVWAGEVWRLATWTFAVPGPHGLVFVGVVLYGCGGGLAQAWGEQRLRRFVAAVIGIAGGGTLALATLFPLAHRLPYFGAWALADALVIAWALEFPERRVRFYSLVSVGGPLLAYATAGLTVLAAAYVGPMFLLPELLAATTALAWMSARDALVRG